MLEITVDGLTKDFGSIRAVDNVSFEVKPGRVRPRRGLHRSEWLGQGDDPTDAARARHAIER
jgi:hypothetical protein